MHGSSISLLREKLIVGLIALFVATAVYTFLGFAWTFKSAVESAQRLKHPFSRGF
jgi:ABC-type antimicrobial peptide transport system permease subunit